jgi:hypothetical protein
MEGDKHREQANTIHKQEANNVLFVRRFELGLNVTTGPYVNVAIAHTADGVATRIEDDSSLIKW